MRQENIMLKDHHVRPSWLTQRIPASMNYEAVKDIVGKFGLHTVCQSAACPNIGECFSSATAAFLILGGICTRSCAFCAVPKGNPLPIDENEAGNLVQAVKIMGLKHVVITSVTRDDLADGGASQFVDCIRMIRQTCPGTAVEILVPDFNGNEAALMSVLRSNPEVFNHNIETVPRLYEKVRPYASYDRSLTLLSKAAHATSDVVKSGIMVGLGESEEEVIEVLCDMRAAHVSTLTIGQYLQPSSKHLPVAEYVMPDKFEYFKQIACEIGFTQVAAGPFVRSSYHAETHYHENRKHRIDLAH